MSISDSNMQCSSCSSRAYAIVYQNYDRFLCQQCVSAGNSGNEGRGWRRCSLKTQRIPLVELKKKPPPRNVRKVNKHPLNEGLCKIEPRAIKIQSLQQQMPFGLARVLIDELHWKPGQSLEDAIPWTATFTTQQQQINAKASAH